MLAPIISAALIGLMASGGPCTAARAIAGSAFYSGPRRVFSLATFTFGAFLTDLALVSSLGFFFRALEISAFCYGVAAIASLIAGVWTIARKPPDTCLHALPPRNTQSIPTLAIPLAAGMGSALLLGACCAPFVLAAAATAGPSADPLVISVAYAAAHAGIPLLLSLWSRQLKRFLTHAGACEAIITIEAGIFIACALYFGALV